MRNLLSSSGVLYSSGGERRSAEPSDADDRMKPTWKHADLFPSIAGIIKQAWREQQRFVTSQEIAARLLQDNEGRNLIGAAREQQEEKQSLESLASNTVSWFSQRRISDSRRKSCGMDRFAIGLAYGYPFPRLADLYAQTPSILVRSNPCAQSDSSRVCALRNWLHTSGGFLGGVAWVFWH